jgi:hypothetical protein
MVLGGLESHLLLRFISLLVSELGVTYKDVKIS